MRKSSLLVSTAVILTMVSPVSATTFNKSQRAMPKRPLAAQRMRAAPPAKGTLKEQSVAKHFIEDVGALYGGLVNLGIPTTVTCKRDCAVSAEAVMQVQPAYQSSYNQIAFCPTVDGQLIDGSCYMTTVPQGRGAIAIPELTGASAVSAGAHTIETYLYTIVFMSVGNAEIDYHVYK